MTDDRTDRIAREAARLIETGREADLARAIRAAAEALQLRDAPMPGYGLVRRHAQGMAMQAGGDDAYRQSIHDVWSIAEQVMTAVELATDGATTLLAGRAAKGQIDAGVRLHLRVYTRHPMAEIVQSLVEAGYEEPTFATAETRFGRLDRISFTEERLPILLTRCLPETRAEAERDLFTGRPIATADGAELRRRLSAGE
jgi:hypothetical protein